MTDTAVLVIDMLNAYRHEDAELLAPNAIGHLLPDLGEAALLMMERNMRAEIVPRRSAWADAGRDLVLACSSAVSTAPDSAIFPRSRMVNQTRRTHHRPRENPWRNCE